MTPHWVIMPPGWKRSAGSLLAWRSCREAETCIAAGYGKAGRPHSYHTRRTALPRRLRARRVAISNRRSWCASNFARLRLLAAG